MKTTLQSNADSQRLNLAEQDVVGEMHAVGLSAWGNHDATEPAE
jgi:hypothetical protein